jgi:hypothetical protein
MDDDDDDDEPTTNAIRTTSTHEGKSHTHGIRSMVIGIYMRKENRDTVVGVTMIPFRSEDRIYIFIFS